MINRKSFICGIKGLKLSKKEYFFLKKYKPWGVILFSRNIKEFKQTRELTDSIKKIFKDKNYPILIDQEGGKVSRIQNLIDMSIFTAKFFGDLYIKDRKKFMNYLNIYINQTSIILKMIGINLNSVPVLDVYYKKSNNIIGSRSFSPFTRIINKIGNLCIEKYHNNNIGTIMKHIPGHGLAKVDSHKKTPVVNDKLSILKKKDFSVFINKKTFFTMTAHIIYNKLDQFETLTHSSKGIKFIREYIGFKNIIITDDISMKGLKYSIKKNTQKAFEAGCNLVLHCNGNLNEMLIVAKNSPKINNFIAKKTSQFYKILS